MNKRRQATAWLDDETYDKLKTLCKDSKRSISLVLNQALSEYMSKRSLPANDLDNEPLEIEVSEQDVSNDSEQDSEQQDNSPTVSAWDALDLGN